MKELILLKNGEIALKGLNRPTFEDKLIKNAKRRVKDAGDFKFYKAQSTIYCEPLNDDADIEQAFENLTYVFGVAALTKACIVKKEMQDIINQSLTYLAPVLKKAKTFKVEAKRSDKTFPLKSPEICMELGGKILEKFAHLVVDVHTPDVLVKVEVRDFAAYVHAGQQEGAGGMPIGTSGKAALLLSGGIDSPVAGYMMAKRGLEIQGIHFASPPYTSEHAKQKVITLCEKMSAYCGDMRLYIVPFTAFQEEIRKNCPEDLFTIIMRRYMMKVSEKIAQQNGCDALITGESLAQVASQTMKALACTDIAVEMPIFRPAIGMDKNDIVKIARMIDTFETSILPYEDCCTVFTPKHPRTKPKLDDILFAEEKLKQAEDLITQCVNQIEIINIRR